MLRKFLLALGVAALAGCATTKPVAVVHDNSPLHPTAVIEKHVTSSGLRGFVPFEADETDYVRTDMRRNDSTVKGTGTVTRFLLGSHAKTRIFRVDRKLLWEVNPDDKEYTQCSLRGCLADRMGSEGKANHREKASTAHEKRSCTLRIAGSRVSVKSTGKRMKINGFDTREYRIDWVITLRDNHHRTATGRMKVDVWTTPLTEDMRRASEMDTRYQRAFSSAAHEGGHHGSEIFPRQAAKLIIASLGNSLHGRDLRRFLSGGRNLRKIHGQPIRTTMSWDFSGNACSNGDRPKQASAGSSQPSGVGGLVSMFTSHESKKQEEGSSGEPLVSFTTEVKRLTVMPIHDSVFNVPAGYKRVQPK